MKVKVLGPLAVCVDGVCLDLGGPLQQRVLAVLLTHRNAPVSRRRLIADVWSDDAVAFEDWELEERKRGVLQTYIARLRALLKPAARAAGQPEVIVTEGAEYRLQLADECLDEPLFRSLLTSGRQVLDSGDPAAASDLLREGLQMWRGRPFGPLADEAFARQTVVRLDALYLTGMESRLEADLRLGRHHDLIGDTSLRRCVQEHPGNERLVSGLAVALHRCGQSAAAADLCRRSLRYLCERKGIDSAALRELLQDIRSGSSRLDVAAPSAPPAVEETAAREPAAQEPAAAHRPPLFMVPTPSGGVVSRDGLLNELLDRLREPGDGPLGVVAAVGAGGFGKTTLAVDACRRPDVRDEFPDGILWVTIGKGVDDLTLTGKINDLSEHLTGERPALADAMQAGFHLGRLIGDSRTLLVVDDVWDAAQLQPFLQGGPRCRRLVTTRCRAALPDCARTVVVDAMSPPEAYQLLTTGLPDLDPDRVGQLAHGTGSWPLLMALVNSQIRTLVRERGATLDEAVTEVDEELRAAGPTALDVSDPGDRWQAVESTVAASLSLLDRGDERGDPAHSRVARYEELAVFPDDDIPRDVLESYWGATAGWSVIQVRRFCDQLAALSLVQTYRAKPPRLRLHSLMHEYLSRRVRDSLPALHAALLDGCRRRLSLPAHGGWWAVPAGERYLWTHLAEHLQRSGRLDELDRTVTDLRYCVAKLRHADAVALESDLTTAGGETAGGPTAGALRQLVRRSSHLLRPDDPPRMLDATLASRAAGIGALTEAAKAFVDTFELPYLVADWPFPDRSDPSLHRVLTGAGDSVQTVRYSPDGRTVAAAGLDGVVRLWDSLTGGQRHLLTGGTSHVGALAFSPRGDLLAAAGGDGTVRLWATATGEPVHTLTGHGAAVSALAFHPRGAILASAGADGTVRLWATATGEPVHTLTGHGPTAWQVRFSPDGRLVASCGDDATVRLWATATGEPVHTLAGHRSSVQTLAFSPDSTLVAAGARDGSVRLWDTATGALRHALTAHANWVRRVVFSPDGRLLASASWDATVRVWDTATGQCRQVLGDHPLSAETVAFSPDGTVLASTAGDGTIRLWHPTTGERLATLTGHTRSVPSIAFSPGGEHLVSGGWDGSVRLWRVNGDAAGGPEAGTVGPALAPDAGPMASVACGPDGRLLVTTGTDGALRLWDARSGRRTGALPRHGRLARVAAFSPDGALLASGAADGTVAVRPVRGPGSGWSGAGHTVAVRAVAFSPDGGRLVSAGDDGTLRMWDVRWGRPAAVWSGNADRLFTVAWSPDGQMLATAGDDGIVRLRDAGSGAVRQSIAAFTPAVHAVAFDPSGGRLAAGGQGGALRVWDLSTGDSRVLSGHDGTVTAVAFSPDARYLASVGDEGTLRVWCTASGTFTAGLRLDGTLSGVTWTPDGGRLAAVGGRGVYAFSLVDRPLSP